MSRREFKLFCLFMITLFVFVYISHASADNIINHTKKYKVINEIKRNHLKQEFAKRYSIDVNNISFLDDPDKNALLIAVYSVPYRKGIFELEKVIGIMNTPAYYVVKPGTLIRVGSVPVLIAESMSDKNILYLIVNGRKNKITKGYQVYSTGQALIYVKTLYSGGENEE